MSKLADEGRLRLKNRVARLHRLLELKAPDVILVRESYLVSEAAQMLHLDTWLAMEKSDLVDAQKLELFLCSADECEEDVAWRPSAATPTAPGPFHMTMCETHALETEKEMAEDDAMDDEE